jgi:cell division protein FtsL
MKMGFVLLFTLVLSATSGAFIVAVALRSEIVRIGYLVSTAHAQQDKLLAQRRLLSLENATLRQVDRIETVGRGAFGMDVPSPSHVIPIGNAPLHISGRAQ